MTPKPSYTEPEARPSPCAGRHIKRLPHMSRAQRRRLLGASVRGDRETLNREIQARATKTQSDARWVRIGWLLALLWDEPIAIQLPPSDLSEYTTDDLDALIFLTAWVLCDVTHAQPFTGRAS